MHTFFGGINQGFTLFIKEKNFQMIKIIFNIKFKALIKIISNKQLQI